MIKKNKNLKERNLFFSEILKILKFTLAAVPKLFNYVINKLRFSISFKITTFYAFIFSFFLLLSNIAVVSGFIYFIQKHADNIRTDQGLLYIEFTKNTIEVNNYIGIIVLVILSTDLLFLMIILGIGSKMSKKLLLPVKKMTDAVKNISLQNMNTRLNISGSKDELKDLAITFNQMLDRLQDSYEIQNRFVSDASHELRTPIAVIQGYANLLDRWGKEDKAVLDESVTAIKSEAENMKNLIEQLLFLARSDKNTQKIEMSEFQVKEVIDEVIKETKMIDSTHNIINEKNEQLKIVADKNLLKQALRIFIDNSIKYTPEGGNIKLNSYFKGGSLVIEIDDTGIGISKEDLPHIFDRFYRADKSRTKKSGGTGLGLSIAKWIILKHKGSVEVQSRPHYGTKMSLRIPI
ncbi:sensor histidine kinase [Candidatus Clostridium stratigraminis]|uniref:histidine kinase n=1 Tax=Candidatus Clostridium stratigraminis TaxID=3381661 RepID=A0ABW8T7C9_9CLOT